MLPDTSVEIARHADIKAARVTAHNVDPSSMPTHGVRVAGSFDSGSAKIVEKRGSPLAFAQDDGII
jgi:hypothetical protein